MGVCALFACQAIIGIEDKQLDPKYSSGTGGAAEAGEAEAGPSPGLAAVPPPRPAGPAVASGKGATRWFAARTIYVGTVDPTAGLKDSDAWKRIGHDIDGECTTPEISQSNTSGVCKKPDGASAESLADGDDCRDNASGRLFAVGIQILSTDFELKLHAELKTADTATYLLKLEDLEDAPDDPYVRGVLYVTVPRVPPAAPPLWNGSDEFAVDVRSVDLAGSDAGPTDAGSDVMSSEGGADAPFGTEAGKDAPSEGALPPSPLLQKPLYVFDKGYVKNNVWVSGDFRKSPMKLPLFVLDRISVADALTVTLAVELTPKHDAAVASLLSAVASTETLQKDFKQVGLEITNCQPGLADLLLNGFVLPARDIGDEPPTFRTPNEQCAAESFGFGFEWKPVKPPMFVVPSSDPPPQCGDGGT